MANSVFQGNSQTNIYGKQNLLESKDGLKGAVISIKFVSASILVMHCVGEASLDIAERLKMQNLQEDIAEQLKLRTRCFCAEAVVTYKDDRYSP